jgi:hypothetical protein
MPRLRLGYAAAAAICLCLSPLTPGLAVAGVADSPVPSFNGLSARHVFTVPGVIKNNNLETVFICTSLDKTSITVGVEVFAASGGSPLNNVGAGEGVETMAPGVTATFATGATVAFHEDDILVLPAASLRNGSARIVSTSKRIGCTAFVVDEISDPPSTMAPLKVLSKTKQHGE